MLCRVCPRLVYEVQYRKGYRAAFFRTIFSWDRNPERELRRLERQFDKAMRTGNFSGTAMQLLLNPDRVVRSRRRDGWDD